MCEPEKTFVEVEIVEPPVLEEHVCSVFKAPTLVDSLRAFILNFHNDVAQLIEDMKQKFQIVISEETLSMLNYILNNYPDDITNIQLQLTSILEDGKINMSDVPMMIKLVMSIYHLLLQKKDEFQDPQNVVRECAVILKMTVYVLVMVKNIPTGKMSQEDFLLAFNNIVDSCLLIVNPYVPQIKPKCFNWVSCLGKK